MVCCVGVHGCNNSGGGPQGVAYSVKTLATGRLEEPGKQGDYLKHEDNWLQAGLEVSGKIGCPGLLTVTGEKWDCLQ